QGARRAVDRAARRAPATRRVPDPNSRRRRAQRPQRRGRAHHPRAGGACRSAATTVTAPRAAAFLDRDGTLIHDAHYLRDPALVRLLPDVTEPLRRLRDAGCALVVVTNQ